MKTTPWMGLLVVGIALTVARPVRGDITTFVTTNLSTFNVGTLTGENGQLLNATNAVTITQLTSGAVLVGSGATGAGGASSNTVIISNALLTASAASFIGGGSSNNSVLLLTNSVWNLGDKVLTIGNSSAAINNNLTVLGGTLTNLGGLTLGGAANANFNSLIVNAGSLSMNAGAINVGAPVTYSQGTTIGGNNNTLVLSNVVMNEPAYHVNGDGLDVGYGSSSNTVTILANTTLNLDGNGVLIGGYSGPLGTGNVLNVTGGILTNINQFYLSLAGVSNQMVISQGGQVWVDQGVWVGVSSRTNLGNQVIVTGPGSALYQTSAGGNINIGANGTTDQANYNSFIVSNGAAVVNSGSTYVGEEGSNNFILVTGTGSVWQTGIINIGNGFGSSNSLTIANGARVVSQTGYIGDNLDGTGGGTNQVLVTGHGSVWSNYFTAGGGNAYSFYVGYSSSGNSLVISNGGLVYSSAASGYPNINSIGDQAGANNNAVLVTGSGSIWTNAIGTVYVGNSGANNSLTAANTGSVYSATIIVGNASSGNNLTVARGGIINVGTSLLAGDQAGANSNTVIVTDPNSILQINGNNSAINGIGNAASSIGNQLVISNGGLLIQNFGYFYVGNGAGANSNAVTVTGSGSVFSNNSIRGITLGAAGASGNRLIVTNGGAYISGNTLSVGSSSGNNNSVLVSGGGILGDNFLTIAGGTGNTISNSGGIYQFTTAGPTIANNGFGNIAINNGTISFLGVNGVDVSNSLIHSELGSISFAGANTFMLNGSSNNTAGQTYDFHTVAGNPSNYVNLAMVNGQTAYQGGNLTIGATGWLLISNTLATISGLVTNQGSLTVAGSTASFQSQVDNTGSINMLNSTVNFNNGLINSGNWSMSNLTTTISGLISNQGTLSLLTANATFQNRFNNSGTVAILGSIGTFSSGVVNAGRWSTDPSTNVFGSFGYTNTISGVISMSAGDVYIFTNTQPGLASSFINASTNNTANNLVNGKLLFSGGLGLTQELTVAGHDLGVTPPLTPPTAVSPVTNADATVLGFTNNFALGTLQIANSSTVEVSDAFLGLPGTNDNLTAALYLQNLDMGANSLLIIDTNVQVYFENSNDWSLANIRLENNQSSLYGGDVNNYNNAINGIHQLIVVPEPNVLLLWLAGCAAIYIARRRHRRRQSPNHLRQ